MVQKAANKMLGQENFEKIIRPLYHDFTHTPSKLQQKPLFTHNSSQSQSQTAKKPHLIGHFAAITLSQVNKCPKVPKSIASCFGAI